MSASRSVVVRCPNPACQRSYRVLWEHMGESCVCPRCGHRFSPSTEEVISWDGSVETYDEQAQQSQAETPLPPQAPVEPPPVTGQTQVPQRIGRFDIRRWLGSGAFGNVYLAHDPVLDRKVAIKVSRDAVMVRPKARAFFLQEGKAAAQLRHPHIVPVFDAGTDGDCYYIAMAYIPGATLQQTMQTEPIGFRRAAGMVRNLAEALDYAHSLGIIHRDVKPANILVDTRGDVLLGDFGLARIVRSRDQRTQHAQGTAEYASPEQAAPTDYGEAGPASDQYSLGVVLYELLCGQRPFDGPPDVVMYNVAHQAPPPLLELNSRIPRDLEAICNKAMSKQPAARYSSCRELAEDLWRWLEGDLVEARPVGKAERFARWCRRNPVIAGLSMIAVALLLTVGVITAVAYVREARLHQKTVSANNELEKKKAELQRTNEELTRQRDNAEVARNKETAARAKAVEETQRAENRFQIAQRAVDQFFNEISEDRRLKSRGLEQLRRELLKMAGDFYLDLIEERRQAGGPQDELRLELGQLHARLAVINTEMGHAPRALREYQNAIDEFEKLDANPNLDNNLRLEAKCHLADGYRGKSVVYASQGDGINKAKEACEKSLAIWKDLQRTTTPEDPKILAGLAAVHASLGMLDWATKPSNSDPVNWRYAESLWRRLTDNHPKRIEYQHELATTLNNFGVFLWTSGEPQDAKQAEKKFQDALIIWRVITGGAGALPRHRNGLAVVHRSLAMLNAIGDFKGASRHLLDAIQIHEELRKNTPDFPQFQNDLAEDHAQLGALYARHDQLPDARKEYNAALQLYEELAKKYADIADYQFGRAMTYYRLGTLEARAKQPEHALAALSVAANVLEELAKRSGKVVRYKAPLGPVYHQIGNLVRDGGDAAGSLAKYDRAIEQLEENRKSALQATRPSDFRLQLELVAESPLQIDRVLGLLAPDTGSLIPVPDDSFGGEGPLSALPGLFRRVFPSKVGEKKPASGPAPLLIHARRSLASAHKDRAEAYETLGRKNDAEADRREADRLQARPQKVEPRDGPRTSPTNGNE